MTSANNTKAASSAGQGQRATEATPDLALLPWVNVVKIGGQSIMDRGRAAVWPLVDEIVANLPRHKMILGTGAGTRARHIYSLAIDLGLPVGVLTVLGTAVAWQNAQMLQYLMARHGIAFLEPEGFASLPHYLMERGAVICQGMPPYKLWEPNPEVGRIPPQRTDTGCFLIAEVFGARKMIYVKDEDGLYTADPKKDRNATHIPRISVEELIARDLDDLVVESAVLDLMRNARHIKEIQFVNGLKPGQLFEGRDLALTTDFRDVFAEVLVRHLGARQTASIFPGFAASSNRFRGFLG